jgi:outer membrane protein
MPYPYIAYSSENLKIDNEGVEHKLFSLEDLTLQLSLSGTLPVESTGAREGMSDLDAAGEIGPSLVYNLYKHDIFDIDIELPIRAVLSTNLKSVEYHGIIYKLKTLVKFKNDKGDTFEIETGPVWADSRYHNYLYGVEDKFVTSSRAKYKAKGGYSGYQTAIGLVKNFKHFKVGAFVKHYSLRSSSISDSPLKERNSALYSGFFLAYIFDKGFSNKVKEWVER